MAELLGIESSYASTPLVVAVSGASGAGKTTLVKELAKTFSGRSLFFDDFVDSHTYPNNMQDWLHQGLNFDDIKTPKFIQAIESLKHTEAPGRLLFIEEPFGRQRSQVAHLVDVVIHLNIPLAISLARIIERRLTSNCGSSATGGVHQFVKNYQDHLFDIYQHANSKIAQDVDISIDDHTLTAEQIVVELSQYLASYCKCSDGIER